MQSTWRHTRRSWLGICLCLLLFFGGCSREHPTVRVAFDPSWRPLLLNGLEPNLTGFCLDLLSAIATSEELAIEALRTTGQNVLYNTESGAYDIGITTVTPTPRLRQIFVFSEPILYTGTSLVMYGKPHTTVLPPLKGMVLGVQENSAAFNFIAMSPGAIFKQYLAALDALEDLSMGRLDAVAMDRLPAITYARNGFQGKLQVLSPPLDTSQAIRFFAKKDSSLFRKVSQGLSRAPIEALRARWALSAPTS